MYVRRIGGRYPELRRYPLRHACRLPSLRQQPCKYPAATADTQRMVRSQLTQTDRYANLVGVLPSPSSRNRSHRGYGGPSDGFVDENTRRRQESVSKTDATPASSSKVAATTSNGTGKASNTGGTPKKPTSQSPSSPSTHTALAGLCTARGKRGKRFKLTNLVSRRIRSRTGNPTRVY